MDTGNELTDLMQNQEREPIELLVLSACETAKGDNRAAGTCRSHEIRAGAKVQWQPCGVWMINRPLFLFQNFYQALIENNVNKAEALRLAQLELLKQKDVYRRSSLLGNLCYCRKLAESFQFLKNSARWG